MPNMCVMLFNECTFADGAVAELAKASKLFKISVHNSTLSARETTELLGLKVTLDLGNVNLDRKSVNRLRGSKRVHLLRFACKHLARSEVLSLQRSLGDSVDFEYLGDSIRN